jgi:hypothetical protein
MIVFAGEVSLGSLSVEIFLDVAVCAKTNGEVTIDVRATDVLSIRGRPAPPTASQAHPLGRRAEDGGGSDVVASNLH